MEVVLCLSQVKVGKIITGVLLTAALSVVYVLGFLYLYLGCDTPWYIFVFVPVGFSVFFVLGTYKRKIIRVTVLLMLPLLLKGFGLLMSISFLTWNFAKTPLSGSLKNFRYMVNAGIFNSSGSIVIDYVSSIENYIVMVNYCMLFAPIAAYIYSFLFTICELRDVTFSGDSAFRGYLLNAYFHSRTLVIGLQTGLACMVFAVEHISYTLCYAKQVDISAEIQDYSLVAFMLFFWLSLILNLLSPFEDFFNTIALDILYMFYPTFFIGRNLKGRSLKALPSFLSPADNSSPNEATKSPMTLADLLCCCRKKPEIPKDAAEGPAGGDKAEKHGNEEAAAVKKCESSGKLNNPPRKSSTTPNKDTKQEFRGKDQATSFQKPIVPFRPAVHPKPIVPTKPKFTSISFE